MKLSQAKSVIAIICAVATAAAHSVEILGLPGPNGKRAVISTPVSIEGCNAGLHYSASKNIYWCPGFMADPDYVAPAPVAVVPAPAPVAPVYDRWTCVEVGYEGGLETCSWVSYIIPPVTTTEIPDHSWNAQTDNN